MSSTEKESSRSAEHLAAQRNRILDAAEECFIKHGFHAASMARIAETAEISQGLAYRYFKNKNAIILAIIERQLEQRHSILDSSEDPEEFTQNILGIIEAWAASENQKMNPVLFMEMSTEASRDPEIQEAMAKADQHYLSDFTFWIQKSAKNAGKSITEESIMERFHMLQAIIEGAAFLAVRRDQVKPVTSNPFFHKAILQAVTV